MSFKPIGDLGSLHNGEGPNMGNEGFFKVFALVFEPLLGGYDIA